jgi:hypothetical protein
MQGIQLSDTAISIAQSIQTYDTEESSDRYLRTQIGEILEREKRQCSQNFLRSTHRSTKRVLPQKPLKERTSIFLRLTKSEFFLILLPEIASLFEERFEDGGNSFLYLSEVREKVQPRINRPIDARYPDKSVLGIACNYLWAIGVLHSKIKGRKVAYRLAEIQEKQFEDGDLIVNLPLSQSQRFGVVQSVKRHPVHAIDILEVTWLDTQSPGIVSSEGTNPILKIAEKEVLEYQGLGYESLEMLKQRQKPLKSMSHSDRLLQFLRYQEVGSLSDFSRLIPGSQVLDSTIRQLEQAGKIKKRSRFPTTFTLAR